MVSPQEYQNNEGRMKITLDQIKLILWQTDSYLVVMSFYFLNQIFIILN